MPEVHGGLQARVRRASVAPVKTGVVGVRADAPKRGRPRGRLTPPTVWPMVVAPLDRFGVLHA
jgi:hypothetical protein